ncbi:sulfotransferase [Rhodohalobacter sulfatireducens]|uniref:Sulfotransferase n=1 Tax=Rhodohalobacter sulfatireducens TaxID=2911366 RepID=A0ABS9K8D0_9BACT|nr:sulfotransferase [Rhodohalobacter sulfatireducens]MCG2587058.1 sulfotransferase [Rhodohalobacter sulfatireducens]
MANEHLTTDYIYILGRGHNGSTVFNLLLGNHPDIESLGEFSSGFQRFQTETCSCGSKLQECKLWSRVFSNLDGNPNWIGADNYSSMLKYLDKFHRLPQVITRHFLPKWVENDYLPSTRLLFKEIAIASNASCIVDSSKELSRGTFFVSKFPENTKIVYLVRDGRAMIWSFLRRFRWSGRIKLFGKRRKIRSEILLVLHIIFSLTVSQVHAGILKFFHPGNIITVKFEDLSENTESEFERIGRFLEKDFSKITDRIISGNELEIGHNIGGNNMRHSQKGTFVFKHDDSWREHFPVYYSKLYLWFGFIHARLNGYRSLD